MCISAPAPNGGGFAFLTYDRATDATHLDRYDETGAARPVLTLSDQEGDSEALQVSPDGQQAVFVLHTGSRREGRSEELRLVDLNSGAAGRCCVARWGRCSRSGRRMVRRLLLSSGEWTNR